jgi:triphosphoribosyl-dephospho-CoA synthase
MISSAIADAFLAASRAELHALKPGNVHIFAEGHRMGVADFEASARACAPWIAKSGASVGERIEGAVTASVQAAGCNTNLGIVLLCAPLARAAQHPGGSLQQRLGSVLANLDRNDAACAYRAIALANPAGLGRVTRADVTPTRADDPATPTVTLLEAMALAAPRDRIARAYTTRYQDVFAFALPALRVARTHASSEALAITTLHMRLMAEFTDTHLVRKFGENVARAIRAEAKAHLALVDPVARHASFDALLAFDASLKARGFNPGTTADFVVATLFADKLTQD